MTGYQWATLAIAAGGFLGTCTMWIVSLTKAVEKIRLDMVQQLEGERKAAAEQMQELREDFLRDQKAQDHNFGEVGAAIREKISTVEKEMHQIEIWGRDNFVLKNDVIELRKDIKEFAAEIRQDFQELHRKIDAKQ